MIEKEIHTQWLSAKQGKRGLEIHLPSKFTTQRPACGFEHVQISQPIGEHPAGAHLPSDTACGTYPVPPGLSSLCGTGAPRRFQDFLLDDRPQLHLTVVSFTDATLLSLFFPHTLADGQGLTDIVKAWCSILNGRKELVPALTWPRLEALRAKPGDGTAESYMFSGNRPSLVRALDMVIRGLWDTAVAWVLGYKTQVKLPPGLPFIAICLTSAERNPRVDCL